MKKTEVEKLRRVEEILKKSGTDPEEIILGLAKKLHDAQGYLTRDWRLLVALTSAGLGGNDPTMHLHMANLVGHAIDVGIVERTDVMAAMDGGIDYQKQLVAVEHEERKLLTTPTTGTVN